MRNQKEFLMKDNAKENRIKLMLSIAKEKL